MAWKIVRFLVYTASIFVAGGVTLSAIQSPGIGDGATSVAIVIAVSMATISGLFLISMAAKDTMGHIGAQADLRTGFYMVLHAIKGPRGGFIILRDVEGNFYAHHYNNTDALVVGNWYKVGDMTSGSRVLVAMGTHDERDKIAIDVLNLGYVPPWLAGT